MVAINQDSKQTDLTDLIMETIVVKESLGVRKKQDLFMEFQSFERVAFMDICTNCRFDFQMSDFFLIQAKVSRLPNC